MHRALQEELYPRLSTVIVLNIATMLMSDGTCNVPVGMGAFEYFQLAEALGAEPLWVINNGISHTYSVPAENIWPLVQVLLATPITTTTTLSAAMFTVLLWICWLMFSMFSAVSQLWSLDLLVVLQIRTRYARLVGVDMCSHDFEDENQGKSHVAFDFFDFILIAK